MADEFDFDVIMVGGGPAGMMAGLLFARAGNRVCVLEKHGDFLRDFRGDTVHPSTMEILDQMGVLDRFLERPFDKVDRVELRVAGRDMKLGDMRHLPVKAPFIAMMPQWEFLDFLRSEAERYPGFTLRMRSEAVGMIEDEGRIAGVRLADGEELRARLVIATDGRDSLVRKQAMLPLEQLGAPMDVLWFHLSKVDNSGETLRGSVDTGRMIVLIDRRTYWQAGFIVAKGTADSIRQRGIAWLRGQIAQAFPDLTFPADGKPDSVDDLKLLSVSLDRLTRWHRPGLLAIGDAAHAMSPIGGVGINLAIQDAVAAVNILALPMARGEDADNLLARVQDRRMGPTRVIQAGQKAIQDRLIDKVVAGEKIDRAPLVMRILDRVPLLRRIPGRIVGLGWRREQLSPALRVHSSP